MSVRFRHNDGGDYLFVSGVVRTLPSIPMLSSSIHSSYFNGTGSDQYGGIWQLANIGKGAAMERF